MIAVIPVRGGSLCYGARETALLAGRALVVGDGTEEAVAYLASSSGSSLALERLELGPFAPAAYARALAARLSPERAVLLPASPDGRDLGPRLASRLGRPLLAGVIGLSPGRATVVRRGGRQLVELSCEDAYVATYDPSAPPLATEPRAGARPTSGRSLPGGEDPVVLEVVAPDPESVDLAEAPRILGLGAGAASRQAIAAAFEVARHLRASVGATRVVTDGGEFDHSRQIGTTGVSVNPRLYLAFGVSGAAQHVAGLGEPAHVVSVNTDPSCPMAALADLSIVSDGPETLSALAERLGERGADG